VGTSFLFCRFCFPMGMIVSGMANCKEEGTRGTASLGNRKQALLDGNWVKKTAKVN